MKTVTKMAARYLAASIAVLLATVAFGLAVYGFVHFLMEYPAPSKWGLLAFSLGILGAAFVITDLFRRPVKGIAGVHKSPQSTE